MQATDEEIWDAFCEAIAEEDRDDILTSMAEAAHDRRYESEVVKIHNRTRHNMINVTVEGTVTYKGNDFEFHLEDGDWNGTVLRGWNGMGTDWEEPEPIILAIAPQDNLIYQALQPGGNPAFLLKKWELFDEREDVSRLIRSYAYDRYVQPGVQVESHYRSKFDLMKIQIVEKSEADRMKKRLQDAVSAGN